MRRLAAALLVVAALSIGAGADTATTTTPISRTLTAGAYLGLETDGDTVTVLQQNTSSNLTLSHNAQWGGYGANVLCVHLPFNVLTVSTSGGLESVIIPGTSSATGDGNGGTTTANHLWFEAGGLCEGAEAAVFPPAGGSVMYVQFLG